MRASRTAAQPSPLCEHPQQAQPGARRRERGVEPREREDRRPEVHRELVVERRDHVVRSDPDLDHRRLGLEHPGLQRRDVAQVLGEEEAARRGLDELVAAPEPDVGRRLAGPDQLRDPAVRSAIARDLDPDHAQPADQIRHPLEQRVAARAVADQRDLGVADRLIGEHLHRRAELAPVARVRDPVDVLDEQPGVAGRAEQAIEHAAELGERRHALAVPPDLIAERHREVVHHLADRRRLAGLRRSLDDQPGAHRAQREPDLGELRRLDERERGRSIDAKDLVDAVTDHGLAATGAKRPARIGLIRSHGLGLGDRRCDGLPEAMDDVEQGCAAVRPGHGPFGAAPGGCEVRRRAISMRRCEEQLELVHDRQKSQAKASHIAISPSA
jgi:hypothetical protein